MKNILKLLLLGLLAFAPVAPLQASEPDDDADWAPDDDEDDNTAPTETPAERAARLAEEAKPINKGNVRGYTLGLEDELKLKKRELANYDESDEDYAKIEHRIEELKRQIAESKKNPAIITPPITPAPVVISVNTVTPTPPAILNPVASDSTTPIAPIHSSAHFDEADFTAQVATMSLPEIQNLLMTGKRTTEDSSNILTGTEESIRAIIDPRLRILAERKRLLLLGNPTPPITSSSDSSGTQSPILLASPVQQIAQVHAAIAGDELELLHTFFNDFINYIQTTTENSIYYGDYDLVLGDVFNEHFQSHFSKDVLKEKAYFDQLEDLYQHYVENVCLDVPVMPAASTMVPVSAMPLTPDPSPTAAPVTPAHHHTAGHKPKPPVKPKPTPATKPKPTVMVNSASVGGAAAAPAVTPSAPATIKPRPGRFTQPAAPVATATPAAAPASGTANQQPSRKKLDPNKINLINQAYAGGGTAPSGASAAAAPQRINQNQFNALNVLMGQRAAGGNQPPAANPNPVPAPAAQQAAPTPLGIPAAPGQIQYDAQGIPIPPAPPAPMQFNN